MKVVKKEYNGRQFELKVSFYWDCVWVVMYEVIRPTWKIFRTRYIDKCGRNLEDFDTVDKAVDNAFSAMLRDLLKEEEIIQKIEEFEKKY
jgi:hypothetical protein